MDKIQHKLAMEFFRSEIKSLAERLSCNKKALRLNQRSASLGQPQVAIYDRCDIPPPFYPEHHIRYDRALITALHIVYGEVCGKCHILDKKKEEKYVHVAKTCRNRMEKYIKEKQDALLLGSGNATRGI
jgi:hypothetical protein